MEGMENIMDRDDRMEMEEGKETALVHGAAGDEGKEEVLDLYVKFRNPFSFEDDTYNGIDLSGMENLTSRDLVEIEKRFYRTGVTSFNPENTATYARIVAQRSTGMPIEFFEQLPLRDMLAVKKAVVSFFYS